VSQEHQEALGYQVLLVSQEELEFLVQLDLQVLLVNLVRLDQQVLLVLRESAVLRVPQALLDLRAVLERPVLLVELD